MSQRRRYTKTVAQSALAVPLLVTAAASADDCNHATAFAGNCLSDYESLRALDPKVPRELTKAICEADDDDWAQIADSVSSRIRSQVNHDYENLDQRKADVDVALNKVLGDLGNRPSAQLRLLDNRSLLGNRLPMKPTAMLRALTSWFSSTSPISRTATN